ncbi:hypothetical protein Cgig2_005740 [Carnegiea gigantea]|uniref:Alpha/beta hydrolase fold-3 domain-containing protein n=1 Tax=Carnegiea gigantea TaxID=171969 RepID=A0A9Q1QIL6_9CARY|nr:hypothetical protein Cgig2_005740 [Carnegiea gigantea]
MSSIANLQLTLSLLLSIMPLLSSSSQLRQDPFRIEPYIIDYRNGTILRVFCIASPFSKNDTIYMGRLAAQARIIALSLDYTLYLDSFVLDSYDDAWAFLKWVVSHKFEAYLPRFDPWLANFGDLDRVFMGGDSAGDNIAHRMAIKAGQLPESVRLAGAFLTMSVDDSFINSDGPGAPSPCGLGCGRMMVYVAEDDELHERDVKDSGWPDQVELVEAEGEKHVFHIQNPHSKATDNLMKDVAEFLNA